MNRDGYFTANRLIPVGIGVVVLVVILVVKWVTR
ncbi:hypothetical protein LCGC14_1158370 [marine sediment metagenome]|uniref:Uncharacterized protein n=1 Tax=marine sediment metagenome TaxID=412755 RepID=A0A0F9MGG0_9ZZZZ